MSRLIDVLLLSRLSGPSLWILSAGISTALLPWLRMRKLTMLQASRRHLPSAAVFVVGWIIAIEGGCWGLRRWAEARLPAAAANAPNVLLIVIDTLRADYLSCQGYGRPTSPNLDAFASEGALFENCYSAASWTPPSHASLLTGQPTNVHKADTQPLDGRLPTLAEVMSHNGYRSAAFSANEGFFTARRRFDRGFQRFDDEFWNWNEWLTGTVYGNSWIRPVLNSLFGANDDYGRVRGPQISDAYLRWLAGGKGRPSFAVLNYMDVHDPYNAPPPFRSRFGGERLPTLTGAERWVWQRTEEERQTRRNNYASCAAYADDCVGRLLRALDERGLASNTLVIITSDHGEMLGEHNLFRHGASLYPEVLHVPLIMRWPGHVPAAKRLQTVVSNRAIASTIVALTGMEAGSPFVDPPLSRLWQDPAAAAAWPHVLAELTWKPQFPEKTPIHNGSLKCLITSQWHLILGQNSPAELYDRRKDRKCKDNLAERMEYESEFHALRDELEKLSPGWL